jgi:hypothetical protein
VLAQKLIELGAVRSTVGARERARLLASLQREYGDLPTEYIGLITYFGGDIEFKEDVSYKPDKRNSWTTAAGKNTLDRIYGLTSAYRSGALAEVAATYKNRIPCYWIPIAAAPGGNQICLCIRGKMIGALYFWDHEWEPDSFVAGAVEEFLVSESLSLFVKSLEVEPPSGISLDNIEIDLKF